MANSGSTCASATQWNARSQAAYHGYSHLSGIEMTSRVVEVPPLAVAAAPALVRRRRAGRVAVEPALHVVVVELLAPEHPGERLAQHERLVVGRAARASSAA